MAGDGTSCHHRVVTGTLYLVGTPIGNLGDLAPRAVETLAAVDLIAAEDTRRTGRLLAHLQLVDRPLISFFEGNERERTEEVLRRLRDGATVALVTDGGMPTVSDPGFRLVRACAAEGIDVRVVPGPSAAIAALAISGLPTDRFVFEGFLPRKAGERRARLEALASDPRTIVVFESPKRVRAMVAEALDALGDRPAAVARELTKLHEEVHPRAAVRAAGGARRRDAQGRDRRRDRRSGTVHDGRRRRSWSRKRGRSSRRGRAPVTRPRPSRSGMAPRRTSSTRQLLEPSD